MVREWRVSCPNPRSSSLRTSVPRLHLSSPVLGPEAGSDGDVDGTRRKYTERMRDEDRDPTEHKKCNKETHNLRDPYLRPPINNEGRKDRFSSHNFLYFVPLVLYSLLICVSYGRDFTTGAKIRPYETRNRWRWDINHQGPDYLSLIFCCQ